MSRQQQRWRIANNSLAVLEQIYQLDRFPAQKTRNELAINLNVSARQIQVWFQNRRQRDRKMEEKAGKAAAVAAAHHPPLPMSAAPADAPRAMVAPAAAVASAFQAAGLCPTGYQLTHDESCETLVLGDTLDNIGGAPAGAPAKWAAAGSGFGGPLPPGTPHAVKREDELGFELGLTPLTADTFSPSDSIHLPPLSALHPQSSVPPCAHTSVDGAAPPADGGAPPPRPPLAAKNGSLNIPAGAPSAAPAEWPTAAATPARLLAEAEFSDAENVVAARSAAASCQTIEQHCRSAVAAVIARLRVGTTPAAAAEGAGAPEGDAKPLGALKDVPSPTSTYLGATVDLGGLPMMHALLAKGHAGGLPARLPLPLGLHAAHVHRTALSLHGARGGGGGGGGGGGSGGWGRDRFVGNSHAHCGSNSSSASASFDLESHIAYELAPLDALGVIPDALGLLDGLMDDQHCLLGAAARRRQGQRPTRAAAAPTRPPRRAAPPPRPALSALSALFASPFTPHLSTCAGGDYGPLQPSLASLDGPPVAPLPIDCI